MKKIIKQEKKLGLKKIQIVKINEMKSIKGGNNQLEFNTGGDEPPTQKPQTGTLSGRN